MEFDFRPSSTSVIRQLNASILSHIPSFNFSQLSQLHLDLDQAGVFLTQGVVYQFLISTKSVVTTFLDSLSYPQFVGLWIVVSWIFLSIIKKPYPRVANAPYHGYRWWFEPTFLLQARTFLYSRNMIKSGFQKVYSVPRLKHSLTHELPSTKTHHSLFESRPRILRSCPTNIKKSFGFTLLPSSMPRMVWSRYASRIIQTKYIDSNVKKQNFGHKYTDITVLAESNLHFRVVQNKLTPELPKYLDIAKTELEYGWPTDVPQPDGNFPLHVVLDSGLMILSRLA